MVRDGGAVDLRDGLAQLLARGRDVRARGGDRIARVRELFGGDRAVRQSPPRRFKSSSAVRSACSRWSICARSSLLCANRPRTWRTARARSASALATAIFASAGSSSSSGCPALHALGVVDVQRQHRAGHLARHLHHVAVDVGIVGGFVVAAVDEPVGAIADGAEHHGGAEAQRPARRVRRGGRRALAFRRSQGLLACSWACSCQSRIGSCEVRVAPRSACRRRRAATARRRRSPDGRGSKLPPTARSSVTRATAWLARMSTMDWRAREHLGLGVEHRQVARESRAVALLGQLVGGLGRLERLLLIDAARSPARRAA